MGIYRELDVSTHKQDNQDTIIFMKILFYA